MNTRDTGMTILRHAIGIYMVTTNTNLLHYGYHPGHSFTARSPARRAIIWIGSRFVESKGKHLADRQGTAFKQAVIRTDDQEIRIFVEPGYFCPRFNGYFLWMKFAFLNKDRHLAGDYFGGRRHGGRRRSGADRRFPGAGPASNQEHQGGQYRQSAGDFSTTLRNPLHAISLSRNQSRWVLRPAFMRGFIQSPRSIGALYGKNQLQWIYFIRADLL
jgi:hypothetical protein